MLEKALEARCCRIARQRRAWALKLFPSVAGLPDRLLLIPMGKLRLVEFKTPGGRVSTIQHRIFGILWSMGFPVHVVRTVEEFTELLDAAQGEE